MSFFPPTDPQWRMALSLVHRQNDVGFSVFDRDGFFSNLFPETGMHVPGATDKRLVTSSPPPILKQPGPHRLA